MTAVLTEPASVAWRAVAVVGEVVSGHRVVVSGTGTVGLIAALVATYRGADVTLLGRCGPSAQSKKTLADRLGLKFDTHAPEPGTVDVWIEAAGSAAQASAALDALRPAGKLVLVSLYAARPDFDVNIAVRKELAIRTSYGSVRADYEQTLDFLCSSPNLGAELVTVFPMAQAEEALRLTAEGGAPNGGMPLIKAAIAPNE
ncbi:zinc-binding dehydrogenase [Crystallibacter degradans]|uniref:zinc-binding dehydrogenase n=1 Tax=Crystallibacter degradans TaxID=2726743 RepID=UPI001F10B78A|nr:zinc-binding dehydrogenase [Arthrobacter sp. SF27]